MSPLIATVLSEALLRSVLLLENPSLGDADSLVMVTDISTQRARAAWPIARRARPLLTMRYWPVRYSAQPSGH